jgi:peptidoglycan hydrolase-like protein with peptidoglycan-binding domain
MRIIKLTESDLEKIVKKVLKEDPQPLPDMENVPLGKVEAIQQALVDAGYDVGPSGVDGKFGSNTRAAIIKYQKANGIKQTGNVGPVTAGRLGVEPLTSGKPSPNRPKVSTTTPQDKLKAPPYNEKYMDNTYVKKPLTQIPGLKSTPTKDKSTTKTSKLDNTKLTQQSKNSGFILIWAFPEYQPKVDGKGKVAQFFGSLIRITSGGGGKEGTYGKLGHGGCVVIRPDGNSICYEFGRYPGAKKGYGKVLTHPLGKIAKIKNGELTNPEQVAMAARKSTYAPGPTMDMSVAVVKLPNPSESEKYASVKQREYSAADFSIGDEDANCGTFARDVAYAGGINMGTFCFPTPNAVVNSFRDKADKMFQI